MSVRTGLTVRQHERREIELPVEFVVLDEHRSQVCFSGTSNAEGQYTLTGHSVDISVGGVGVTCRQYLPRGCRGLIRVYDPHPVGSRQDGSPVLEVAFEHRVKVRRTQLANFEPVYFIGLSFVDPEPDVEQRISSFLHKIDSAGGVDVAGRAPDA